MDQVEAATFELVKDAVCGRALRALLHVCWGWAWVLYMLFTP